MGFALKRDRRFTYGDCSTWDDEQRWELIEGVPCNMTPTSGRIHQDVLGKLASTFLAFLEKHPCKAYFVPFDVRLPEADEADEAVATVVQPDLAVICDPAKLDDRGCRERPT